MFSVPLRHPNASLLGPTLEPSLLWRRREEGRGLIQPELLPAQTPASSATGRGGGAGREAPSLPCSARGLRQAPAVSLVLLCWSPME